MPAHEPSIRIRPATEADLRTVLQLNAEWQHVTSPLDEAALAHLHTHSAYHRVAEAEGEVVAFLLAFGPDAPYDSPNYRWFDAHSSGFLYIDRVVVSAAHQGGGFGHHLYRDLEAFAREAGVRRLVCEVDAEPLNGPSDAFHSRRGFAEVGTQWLAGGTKRVSLRELPLVTIARMTPAEVEPVRELIARTIERSYTGVYPPRAVDFFKAYHSAEAIRDRDSAGTVLVCRRGDDLVGTGSLVREEISGVFVDPDSQGLGIGGMLMDTLEQIALGEGAARTSLSVSLPSRGFYERCGYTVDDGHETDVGQGQRLAYWEATKELPARAQGVGEG